MRRLSAILIIIVFLTSLIPSTYASSQMSEFLCEIGIKFYQQGRIDEALHEFKKALMVQPNYEPAIRYIQMIGQAGGIETKKEEIVPAVVPVTFRPTASTSSGAISEMLEFIEIQREMIKERQLVVTPQVISPKPKVAEAAIRKAIAPPMILTLDDSLSKIPQPIDIEQGKSIIIAGKNIQRFLATQPDILTVEKKSPDELLVTGKGIGYTYLHIWDNNGRWTSEWLGVFPKPEGPTYEEQMRRAEETSRNFRLIYSIYWSSYENGRRLNDLERSYYLWSHSLNLTGPTPYGDLDSSATIRRNTLITDLTNLSVALNNAQIGPFKGFNLHGFDFSPPFTNLAFPGETLRGGMLTSSVFNKELDFAAFWGREGGGRYGNLSPSLLKTKDSFLDGFYLNYSPTRQQNYKFSLLHGWGRDRDNTLSQYAYDLINSWNFDNWRLGYETAYDSEKFAQLLNFGYTPPKLNLTVQLRDVNRAFKSIIGNGYSQGERGGLFNLRYTPVDKLEINTRLDVFQSRLYPASDNDNRWNEDLNWGAVYRLDPLTSLSANYSFQNNLGQISQYRYQNTGLGLGRRLRFIKDIDFYLNYNHQENKSYSSPSSDYINDRVYSGIRFSLIGQLYGYLNKEINWVEARYTADRSRPNAFETGIDWQEQIYKTPFYGNFRLTYRDEENTVSSIAFLSGEDYIEGYTELTYRPPSGNEIYGNCRIRNAWADNPSVAKRVEASFNAGMRYLWDTGVRWEAIGNIEGYVFKDFNSDGLRQRDDAPVEGIKVWLGKDKFQVTDIFGYYKFKGIKARKAYVTIDTSTVPSGFVLTVPVTQEVAIAHHATSRIDFGIISRSEISGLVFEDVDGNGEYSKDDKGILGVVMLLEDGSKSVTDGTGRYSFPNAPVGEHTITLDLSTLPVYYLPKTALTKKITLFDGVTYISNIPLKRIKE